MKTPKVHGLRRSSIALMGFVCAIGIAFNASASFAASGAITYTFDALGRISTATYNTGVILSYSYDLSGNQTQVQVTYTHPVALPVSASVWPTSNMLVPPNLTGTPATSVAVSTAPTHGVVTVSGLTMRYAPTPGYLGPDSYQYIATGAGGTSDPALVSITVAAPKIVVLPLPGLPLVLMQGS
jgi:hypothetical protein